MRYVFNQKYHRNAIYGVKIPLLNLAFKNLGVIAEKSFHFPDRYHLSVYKDDIGRECRFICLVRLSVRE